MLHNGSKQFKHFIRVRKEKQNELQQDKNRSRVGQTSP